MTRDQLEQAKKDLLSNIRLVLDDASMTYGLPQKAVEESIQDYAVNLVEDFFYDALCEIQENEEKGTHGATEHV